MPLTEIKKQAVNLMHQATQISELENAAHPTTQHWLSLAQQHFENSHPKALEETLYTELCARQPLADQSTPSRDGDWIYFSRIGEHDDYPTYWRYPAEGSAEQAQCFLDVRQLAAEHRYLDIGNMETSPDGMKLAISLDTRGDEHYCLQILDLATQQWLDWSIDDMSGDFVWAGDSQTLLITQLDERMRPDSVWRHQVGQTDAQCIYQEPTRHFWLSLGRTLSRQWLLIEASSKTSTEVHLLPAEQPESALCCLWPRQTDVEISVNHQGQHFIVLSNHLARSCSLHALPEQALDPARQQAPTLEDWQTIIAPQDETTLDGFQLHPEHLLIEERSHLTGLCRLKVMDWPQADPQGHIPAPGQSLNYVVATPDDLCSLDILPSEYPANGQARLVFESLRHPAETWSLSLDSGDYQVLKRQQVNQFDSTALTTRYCSIPSSDGAEVPLLLVARREVLEQGHAPLVIYGYGAYGDCLDPWFSSARLSLLDRGWIYAIAQVRGGSEKGDHWYQAGRQHNKPHSFDDLEACIRYVIKEGLTSPAQLALWGGSAGGLLVGATLNRCPELVGTALMEVPFVDCLRAMQDPSLPLTEEEYEEWGNPSDPDILALMQQYDPINNLPQARLPTVLMTTGLNDPRVPYWQVLKYYVQWWAHNTDPQREPLLYCQDEGHSGASARFEGFRETARLLAFLIHHQPSSSTGSPL